MDISANINNTHALTLRRMDVAEELWLTPIVNFLTDKTKCAIETVLCYISRDPTDFWKEMKELLVQSSMFLGSSAQWKEVSNMLIYAVCATYIPLYLFKWIPVNELLKKFNWLEWNTDWTPQYKEQLTEKYITNGLSNYENTIYVLRTLSWWLLNKAYVMEWIEQYISNWWKMTLDLKWLVNIIQKSIADNIIETTIVSLYKI
jgi:hypothetical protein